MLRPQRRVLTTIRSRLSSPMVSVLQFPKDNTVLSISTDHLLHLATKPRSRESDDVSDGGSKSDKSNARSESEEETRSGGGARVRFRPLRKRRKERQHGWSRPAVSIPLFDYLGSKFKDLTTLKRFAHVALLPEAEPLVNVPYFLTRSRAINPWAISKLFLLSNLTRKPPNMMQFSRRNHQRK